MKHPLLFLSAAIATAVGMNASAATQGVLNLQGSVVNSTCAVATASENQMITLPSVKVDDLFVTGVRGNLTTPFQITLTGCEAAVSNNIAVSFSAVTSASYSDIIENTGGTATGVGLVLFDEDSSTQINTFDNISATSHTIPVRVTPGTMTFNFSVDYVASADVVTAGSFGASVDFFVIYP